MHVRRFFSVFAFIALSLGASAPTWAAVYNYSAATDICGAGGLTITVAVGDTVNISDTQDTCGTGNVTGMANRGIFSFIPNGTDFIFRVVATTAGIGTGTVTWTDGNVFSITVTAGSPTVNTLAATAVSDAGASLNGQVTPNGAATTASFDYGLSTAYGTNVVVGSIAGGSGTTATFANLTGLACGTTYHFRANGTNSAGTANGSDQTFTTSACQLPAVTTGAATSVGPAGATLNALVTANGTPTTVSFEYGLTVAYGSSVAATLGGSVGAAAVDAPAAVTLSSLACGTTFHFRAVASNAGGVANGADQAVTTNACAAAPVPTLSEWSLILLSLMMGGLAVRLAQKRRP